MLYNHVARMKRNFAKREKERDKEKRERARIYLAQPNTWSVGTNVARERTSSRISFRDARITRVAEAEISLTTDTNV